MLSGWIIVLVQLNRVKRCVSMKYRLKKTKYMQLIVACIEKKLQRNCLLTCFPVFILSIYIYKFILYIFLRHINTDFSQWFPPCTASIDHSYSEISLSGLFSPLRIKPDCNHQFSLFLFRKKWIPVGEIFVHQSKLSRSKKQQHFSSNNFCKETHTHSDTHTRISAQSLIYYVVLENRSIFSG